MQCLIFWSGLVGPSNPSSGGSGRRVAMITASSCEVGAKLLPQDLGVTMWYWSLRGRCNQASMQILELGLGDWSLVCLTKKKLFQPMYINTGWTNEQMKGWRGPWDEMHIYATAPCKPEKECGEVWYWNFCQLLRPPLNFVVLKKFPLFPIHHFTCTQDQTYKLHQPPSSLFSPGFLNNSAKTGNCCQVWTEYGWMDSILNKIMHLF